MKIPACPNCGKEDWVYICEQWQGPVQRFFNFNGEFEEINIDDVKTVSRSEHVRCCSCRKIRKDLKLENGKFKIVQIGG